ncbi:putative MFS transporter [Xylona heveae TC161]|uniref:Putative MFS transporter n=1 Tax=Xylona heveae (strain CBS 132557 / TC161) TaxID=1328760 RepID=A0A161TDG8_XYLHT|nr:putative MFS transporter [Xylona heveae TC161]KZF23887.1 putative MFS transporter [Xylona heveae TC161]
MSFPTEQGLKAGPVLTDNIRDDLEARDTTEIGVGEGDEVSQTVPEAKDPDVVDWDGPDDPANPRNWKRGTKLMHVLLVSAFTLYSNLAAVMFAPGALALVHDFGITNTIVASLTVTIYILGFAIGPLVLASLSETYGRLMVYHMCNVVYIGFTIGCALSTDTAMFLVFRFICGCAASSPMSIGGGTIADLHVEAERGKAMALFGLGPLLGPFLIIRQVIGPVIGGFVTQDLSWRWTFWLILILSSVVSLIALAVMRETYEPILLERKAARLRKATGNDRLQARTYNKDLTPQQLLARAVVRPTKMLIFSPIVLLLSIYCAFMFGLTYLLFTTFPAVFEETYGWGPGIAGLAYLGLGLGMIFSIALFGLLSDKLLNQPRGGTVERPELRLLLMMWLSPMVPVGFFWYGWSAHYHTHWIVPILGTFFIGLSSFLILMPAQIYLVDAFGSKAAASALAGNVVLRSLFGAFLPLAGPRMYSTLGLGWGNSLLAFIALAFVPVPLFFYKYGERLRNRFPVDY